MRKIVVSSNCQTIGLARSLKAIFPDDKFVAAPLPDAGAKEREAELIEELKAADIWITIGDRGLLGKYGLETSNPTLQFLKTPAIGFSAFHPDLCYARHLSANALIIPHYNSAIAVWAYKHGVSAEAAVRLYSTPTYAGLGYFDQWDHSAIHLRNLFVNSGLGHRFERFFLYAKRGGVFMHSLNHPKINALVQLAKILALSLGKDDSVFEQEFEVADNLATDAWPVFPEVADHLLVYGTGYQWKASNGEMLIGLPRYIDNAFNTYKKLGVDPSDIELVNRDEALYDRVLAPQLGATN